MVYFWKLFWILGNLTWNSEFRSHFSSRTKFREKSCIFSQNQCEISSKTWFKSGFFITKCIKIVSEAITVCVGIFPAEKHRLILQIGSKKSQMRIWVVRGWARPLRVKRSPYISTSILPRSWIAPFSRKNVSHRILSLWEIHRILTQTEVLLVTWFCP